MTRVFYVVSPHLDDAALSCSLLLAANPGSYRDHHFAAGPAFGPPVDAVGQGMRSTFRRGQTSPGSAGAKTSVRPHWSAPRRFT